MNAIAHQKSKHQKEFTSWMVPVPPISMRLQKSSLNEKRLTFFKFWPKIIYLFLLWYEEKVCSHNQPYWDRMYCIVGISVSCIHSKYTDMEHSNMGVSLKSDPVSNSSFIITNIWHWKSDLISLSILFNCKWG